MTDVFEDKDKVGEVSALDMEDPILAMEHSYDSYAEALDMLEKYSKGLTFEVFYSYTRMVANGDLKLESAEKLMLRALCEWDLV